MKKTIALFLTIFILTMAVCSCNVQKQNEQAVTSQYNEIPIASIEKQTTYNSEKNETTIKKTESTSTSDNEIIITNETHTFKTGYKITSSFIEMPSRILITGGAPSYYSKADEEMYTFCFDPLCSHSNADCIALKFMTVGNMKNAVYSSETNRIYMPRGENIFSMKFDSTDVKIEVSMGDDGKDLIKYPQSTMPIENLQIYDKYLFFVNIQAKTIPNYYGDGASETIAVKTLFRYNCENRTIENLFERSGYEGNNFVNYYIANEKIFFIDINSENGARFHVCDIDFENIKDIENDNFSINTDEMIYDGERFFTVSSDFSIDEVSGKSLAENYYIICIDPNTEKNVQIGEKIIRGDNNKGNIKILAVTDEYIYYTENDPFLIGTLSSNGKETKFYTSDHTTYRISKDGSGKTVVFEGVTSADPTILQYAIKEMYIFGSKVIANVSANKYEPPRTLPNGKMAANWQHTQFVTFDIAPDGSFVNMHELALDIDE